MLDHVYISVTDPVRSLAFYVAALEPLGWQRFFDYDGASGPDTVPDLWGITAPTDASGHTASIWLRRRRAGETGLYLGIAADDPQHVDAAHAAGVRAGGTDDGAPGPRAHFGPHYYAANLVDLDDNRLEFVHKSRSPVERDLTTATTSA